MAFQIAEHEVRIARAEGDALVLYDASGGGPDHIALSLKHGGDGGAIVVSVEGRQEATTHRLQPGEATVLMLRQPRRVSAWAEEEAASLGLRLLAGEPQSTRDHPRRGDHHRDPQHRGDQHHGGEHHRDHRPRGGDHRGGGYRGGDHHGGHHHGDHQHRGDDHPRGPCRGSWD